MIPTTRGGKHRPRKTGAEPTGGKGATNTRETKQTKPADRKRGFFRRYWWALAGVPAVILLGLIGTFVYVYMFKKLNRQALINSKSRELAQLLPVKLGDDNIHIHS